MDPEQQYEQEFQKRQEQRLKEEQAKQQGNQPGKVKEGIKAGAEKAADKGLQAAQVAAEAAQPELAPIIKGARIALKHKNTAVAIVIGVPLAFVVMVVMAIMIITVIFFGKGANAGDCSTNLMGSDNAAKVYNYYTGKGVPAMQTAAIMGNFQQESAMDPTNVNPSSGAYGLAQWLGGRYGALVNYAESRSQDKADMGVQLDYSWAELTGAPEAGEDDSQVLADMKAAPTIDEATVIFSHDYERAGTDERNDAQRIQNAKDFLDLYGGTESIGLGGDTGDCILGGGVGIDETGFAFPLRTTQTNIKAGVEYPSGSGKIWKWNPDCLGPGCHHDYFAADIHIPEGTPVLASRGGEVIKAVDTSCYSGSKDVPRVQIKGEDGLYYYYTHMRPGSIKVKTGDVVKATDQLGVVGPGECAEGTGPHVHFQVSSVPISNTEDLEERTHYIDPQPALKSSYEKLPRV